MRVANDRKDLTIHAPLVRKTKVDVVAEGLRLGAPAHLTYSCYNGGEKQCGQCATCQQRIDAFLQVGYIDPVAYAIPIDWNGCQEYPVPLAR